MSQIENGSGTSMPAVSATTGPQETAHTLLPSLNKQTVISGKAFAFTFYDGIVQISPNLARQQSTDKS